MQLRGVLLLAAIGVGTHGAAASEVTERFEKTVPLSAGGSFRLENVNGGVLIESWAEQSVHITAEKRARTEADLRNISIEVDGEGGSVSVRTRHVRREDSDRDRSGSVSYRVRVPQDANVDANTVNGKLEIRDISGSVRASTVNGGVRLEDVAGDVNVSTVNGGIEARYREATDGRHRFSTTNGSVTIELPAGAGGEFDARTQNGSIVTDFPVTMSGTLSRRHLSGQFGSGAARFEMSTVNGSVNLRSR